MRSRRGIGGIGSPLEGCRSLMLWVLEGNPARSFYERMGGRLLDAQQMGQGAVEVAYSWLDIESLCGNAAGPRGGVPGLPGDHGGDILQRA